MQKKRCPKFLVVIVNNILTILPVFSYKKTEISWKKLLMKLNIIIQLIDGVLCNPGVDLEWDIKGGCGADLMSDVLASIKPDAVLITGLCNPQVVRTAQMADVRAVILVRGKQPPTETIELATRENLPIISCPYGMFEVCGQLFQAGLPSFERNMLSNNQD
jgi:predicted transcriptional regulator